jgi:hypothetical protein
MELPLLQFLKQQKPILQKSMLPLLEEVVELFLVLERLSLVLLNQQL